MEKDYLKFIDDCEMQCAAQFKHIDEVALHNQRKVLDAFAANRVGAQHFSGTNGYGYNDLGRDVLNQVFADVFGCHSSIVSPYIASGTHALSLCLFGLLKHSDTLLSISGTPYDTLLGVITGNGINSLADHGVKFSQIDLKNNEFDFEAITNYFKQNTARLVYIQRSRGYEFREALSIEKIASVIKHIKEISPNTLVMVDNCYGEFVETQEPTNVGADCIAGSLIKNAGGGLAASGGYIAGSDYCVTQISYRMTAPSIGCEVGSYSAGYRLFYQGLFLAPHIVAQALKGNVLMGKIFDKAGYTTLPDPNADCLDLIRSIKFDNEKLLLKFCQTVQECSPIDSYALPLPSDMPGYENQVVMAAGCFVQGSTIELSCDAPMRPPYVAYLQGGLTYEHTKIFALECAKKLKLKNKRSKKSTV